MKAGAMPKDLNTKPESWPVLGNPQEIAFAMGGKWTSEPQVPISAIRHRLDLIENELKGFLFAPEIFARVGGTAARSALLAGVEAVDLGAAGLVVTARPRNLEAGFPCLIVNDPPNAIQKLAVWRRANSSAKFIAVTGSVGKTTTKNMVHCLASAVAPAHRSIANYNMGVKSICFTLSNLSPAHKFSTAEFNEVTDLEEQTHLYKPHIAILTNILWEHVDAAERQGFSGSKAIPRLAYLAAGVVRAMPQGGTCVLNADEENFDVVLSEIRKSPHVKLRTFGRFGSNDVRIIDMELGPSGSDIVIEIERKRYKFRLGLPGKHMAINSVAAATAAHFAGVDLDLALSGFENFQAEARRGVRTNVPWQGGQIKVRDETFSSSIPSLRSSFAQLEMEAPEKGGRRIAVLGQVGELGSSMPKMLKELARDAAELNIDKFYTIGSDTRVFNEAFPDRNRVAPHFQTLAQLESALKKDLQAGDMVLLKGSDDPKRDISLNRFVDRLAGTASAKGWATALSPPAKRLVVGGDTYFGEFYQEKRAKIAKINYLETFGYDYSGAQIAPLFQRADFAVANLECALTKKSISGLEDHKSYILRAKPQETIEALKTLNISGVFLGNNHAMDYLSEGLSDTLDYLSEAEIAVSGAGRNRGQAQQAILKEFDVDGIPFKVAVLSGYQFNEHYDSLGLYAGSSSIGVNNINTTRLHDQIVTLKESGYFIVMSPHWGANYYLRSSEQTNLAQRLVSAGVDVILGHGPHMMNDICMVDGVWVVYSLGNLIFNSEGEYESRGVQPYSLIAEMEFSRRGRAVSGLINLYPIVSCNQLTQFQPTFVDDLQFEQVVGMLKGMYYDSTEFTNSIGLRQVDGRRCMTMKVF